MIGSESKTAYYLSLGSNLGDREQNLSNARGKLQNRNVILTLESSIYETEPFESRRQPWFLNQVIAVQSKLNPHELLAVTKAVEKEMGRDPAPKNEPRIIDIDILLAADQIIRTSDLIIPHPRFPHRNFVLIPLREIAADIRHPELALTIAELEKKCPDKSKVFLYSNLKK